MKKLSGLICLFVLLTAFTCENEPLEGDFSTGADLSCEEALLNTVDAALAFTNAVEADYTQLCIAYKTALQDQIEACGDPDGAIQSGIDALGNCNPGTGDDCENAVTAVNLAQVNFENASSEFYTDLCNTYKLTLQNQIVECGDDDGSIQSIIDDLGDCTQGVPEVEISVVAGTLQIDFDIVNVVVNGDILEVTGQTSVANNYMIYFEVEQGVTGDNIIDSTFVLSLTSDFFPSTNPAPFDFLSSITTNNPGVLIGTFGNVVTNADGGDLSLTSGIINVTY